MDYLHEDIKIYCNKSMLENIETNYSKIVGVKSNLNIFNENNKCPGKVLLVMNNKKVFLDQTIQFKEERIKWRSSKISDDGFGFYLIDPYWVSSYAPDPKIKVPIKVMIEAQLVIEMRELNYKQFQQSRLYEFYYKTKIPHAIVSAYQNFYKMNRPGQYYLAINSTVRNYFISQEKLQKYISRINQEKNRIKNEWNKYLNIFLQENDSARLINKLFITQKDNIIKFKTSLKP